MKNGAHEAGCQCWLAFPALQLAFRTPPLSQPGTLATMIGVLILPHAQKATDKS